MTEEKKKPAEKDSPQQKEKQRLSLRTTILLLTGLFLLSLATFLTMRWISVRSGAAIETFRELADLTEAPSAAEDAAVERININTADAYALTRLPGIGERKAAAIVADREEYGMFTEPADLYRVRGIGEKLVEAITPYICFYDGE